MKKKNFVYIDSVGYNPVLKIKDGTTNPIYKFAKAVQLNSFLDKREKEREIKRMK